MKCPKTFDAIRTELPKSLWLNLHTLTIRKHSFQSAIVSVATTEDDQVWLEQFDFKSNGRDREVEQMCGMPDRRARPIPTISAAVAAS